MASEDEATVRRVMAVAQNVAQLLEEQCSHDPGALDERVMVINVLAGELCRGNRQDPDIFVEGVRLYLAWAMKNVTPFYQVHALAPGPTTTQ